MKRREVLALFLSFILPKSVFAKKKKKDGIVEDTDRDGVVEFAIPLYRSHLYTHECCGCGLTHQVSTHVVYGPLGLPWLYSRWEVDNIRTHKARLMKFGPGYWIPSGVGRLNAEERHPFDDIHP